MLDSRNKYLSIGIGIAILCSVILLFLGLYVNFLLLILKEFNSESIWIFISFLFGIIGFYGLISIWKNRLETKQIQSLISLVFGIAAISIFSFITEINFLDIERMFDSFVGFFVGFLFLWPNLVATFYSVLLLRKIIFISPK